MALLSESPTREVDWEVGNLPGNNQPKCDINHQLKRQILELNLEF